MIDFVYQYSNFLYFGLFCAFAFFLAKALNIVKGSIENGSFSKSLKNIDQINDSLRQLKAKRMEIEPFTFLSEINKHGLCATIDTYNLLIEICETSGNYLHKEFLFTELTDIYGPVLPNCHTVILHLEHLICHNNGSTAEELNSVVSRYKFRGVELNASVDIFLLNYFSLHGRDDLLLETYNNSEKDFSVRRIICEILLRKNFTVLREGCYKQILDENIQFIEEIDKIKYIEVCKLCGEAPKIVANIRIDSIKTRKHFEILIENYKNIGNHKQMIRIVEAMTETYHPGAYLEEAVSMSITLEDVTSIKNLLLSGHSVSLPVLTSALYFLNTRSEYAVLQLLFNKHKTSFNTPNESISLYNVYLHLLLEHNLFNDALKLSDEIDKSSFFSPDSTTYVLLFRCYIGLNDVKKVKGLFDFIKTFLKVKFCETVYKRLLAFFAERSDLEYFSKICDFAKEDGYDLKEFISRKQIEMFMQLNLAAKAFSYVSQCEKENVALDIDSYGNIITLQILNNYIDRAVSVMKNMLFHKITPTYGLYMFVIENCINLDRPKEAAELIFIAVNDGYKFNLDLWDEIIENVKNAHLDSIKFFEKLDILNYIVKLEKEKNIGLQAKVLNLEKFIVESRRAYFAKQESGKRKQGHKSEYSSIYR